MVRAIFFDIDGTLVGFNIHKVSGAVRQALNAVREKGIKIFIATGRLFPTINNLDDLVFDGYITLNGAYCIGSNKNVIFKKSIDKPDINSFLDYLEQDEMFPCAFVEENHLSINYVDREMAFLLELLKIDSATINPLEYYRDREIFQITAFFKEHRTKDIMNALPDCSAMRWYPTFADVISKGVDKGVGIDRMCDYFGFSVEDTMAFGDGGNDIGMLRHAGIGIAMGNANDEVKANADYVTDSVDNDGVITALQHFDIL